MEENRENMEMEEPREDNLEFIADTPKEEKKSCRSSKGGCNMIHWIVEGVLLLAVIALFILHFTGGKCGKDCENAETAAVKVATKPGNGNILYVNLDTIYECDLFKEKQSVLDEEAKKLESTFTTRQSKLEADYTQFQKNVQSGVLTETQMQYTYQQLETESNKIREDYQVAMEALAQKQADLTNEMLDALREAANSVNASVEGEPASYVVTYSATNPTVVVVDSSRDITDRVVSEMNKKCAKKTDK